MINKAEFSRTAVPCGFLVVAVLAACGSSDPYAPRTYTFGPFPVEPGQEITDQCVSITLDNSEPIYVNQVELDTGPGFHHSNWFWVPKNQFAGPDGVWPCSERHYSEAAAGLFGAVVFAQSTQALHEVQAFPAGAATKIPPNSKLVAGTHLMNATDAVLRPRLELTITAIPEADVTTELHGLAFQNQSILLPPRAKSRFTVECDLTKGVAIGGGTFERPPPTFKIHHVLAHYHELGAGLTFEALRDSDGQAEMMFETATRIGDGLAAVLDPPFDLTGHAKLRFSCLFDNPRDTAVGWGVGDQEMCIVFAFTDSPQVWSGGVPYVEPPGPGVETNGIIDYTHDCVTIAVDGTH